MKDRIKEKTISDLKISKQLLPFIKPYLWMFAVSIILVFIVIFLELLMPVLIKKALDGFIMPTNLQNETFLFGFHIKSFQIFCLIMLLYIFIFFVIDFFQSLFMEYTGQKIILNLRTKLFSHMAFLPVKFYDKNLSGRLVSYAANDVENMNEMFSNILLFVLKDIILMAGVMVILFSIDIKLALYLSLLVPIVIISINLFSKFSRDAFRSMRKKISQINHNFSETIKGLKIIQTTTSRNRFFERFESLNFKHFTAALLQIKIFSIFMPLIGFLSILSIAIIVHTGSLKVIDNAMSLGELVAFLSYIRLFFRPLRELSEKFNLLQNALASAERIINVLNVNKQETNKGKKNIDKIFHIAFENLGFSYDKEEALEPVLKNISFELKKSKSIGFVGQTGAGKTSIANLISGFYKPDSGKILINNMDYNSISVKSVRDKIALVMQDSFLFAGTIKENISPPYKNIDEKFLHKALKDANCDFLYEKFSGLKTVIKEGGLPLSSGEKQLVCIARAFAINPDLIIFDEATSNMDSFLEQKIHDAMKKLMEKRLAIVIAHRLSTIRNCDSIALIQNKTIKEKGTHYKLVKNKKDYYHLLKAEF